MEMDFDIDKEMEHRLKWNWCAKWKMVRLLKKTIDIAESSLDDDARFLKSAIEEKNRQQEYMESATEEEKKARHETMYNKQCELEKIFNLTGFVDINSIDICLLSQKMIKERKKWSRNLYARYAYMLMYELTEDITQLLGNDKDKKTGHVYGIRTLVKSMGDQELENELNNNSKLWNGFWDKIGANGRDFSSIRNTSTAHRDHDFLKQYEAMTKISWGSALADISEFSYFNFRPRGKAKCFVGDVGSVGIAFIMLFAIGKLILSTNDITWLAFLLVYGVDGCCTIIHRIMLHENLGQAHRKHAYQLMANELGMSHVTVSLLYMAMQLAVSLGFIYLCPDTVLAHWIYLVAAGIVLAVVYVLFKMKYYHLHEEYLKSL